MPSPIEVAMHDAATMGGVEGGRDLDRGGQEKLRWQGAPRQPVGERFTFDELQDQVVHLGAVQGGTADVEQRADVRVVEGRDGLGFALEAGPAPLVCGEGRG
jgi:hypothetical protein